MERYLLDTHIFLWWISDANRLSQEVLEVISDASNPIYVSSATIWEIAIKKALGKISVDADLSLVIESNGFLELPISARCAAATKKLEQIHRDPFDRILIAQAMKGNMTLVTVDRHIVRYSDVKLLSFKR